MKNFILYLDQIQKFIKEKDFDKAWNLSNKALLDLKSTKDDSWYLIYYQLSEILARKRDWENSLLYMGFMIMEYKMIGGKGHENHIRKLLGKLKCDQKYGEFLEICIKSADQVILKTKLKQLLDKDN